MRIRRRTKNGIKGWMKQKSKEGNGIENIRKEWTEEQE